MRLNLLERRAHREGQVAYERDALAIGQTVVRLQRVVSDLLDVARLRQGLFTLEVRAFDLVEVLQGLVSIWSTPEQMIHLRAPDHLIVTADQSRLQQALDNLLSNAISHAEPHTAVQVTVSEEPYREGPWVAITVSNQGPPIPPDLLATLFLPFAKGAQSHGMGLGLFLAERIAHAHGGTLTVHTARSEAGPTTHFVLSWPRTPVDDHAERPSQAG